MEKDELLQTIGKRLKKGMEPSMGEVLNSMTSDEVNRFYDGLAETADRHDQAEDDVKFSEMIPDDIREIYETARSRVIEQADNEETQSQG